MIEAPTIKKGDNGTETSFFHQPTQWEYSCDQNVIKGATWEDATAKAIKKRRPKEGRPDILICANYIILFSIVLHTITMMKVGNAGFV